MDLVNPCSENDQKGRIWIYDKKLKKCGTYFIKSSSYLKKGICWDLKENVNYTKPAKQGEFPNEGKHGTDFSGGKNSRWEDCSWKICSGKNRPFTFKYAVAGQIIS